MQSDSYRNLHYTIYDRATGEIVMSGCAGSPESLNVKMRPGHDVLIDQQIDGATHRVNPKTGRPNKLRQPLSQ